ncbi:family 1 glycosylhydrolase [Brevundimonas sp. DWR2-3-1b1]|uniref:family 1 glycosylhydrolase n=1 Tax=unclassified Brevundimonas TaxID=2622653 RepID=UPI003CEB5088
MTGCGPGLWGGPECTLNRIGDVWRDQTRLSGHHDRIDDLDRFAELGLEALRYPVLWERTETAQGVWDWTWPDPRLSRLRSLGLRPIVGLLHHGSGPAWTDLLDPGFAEGLARHAACTAERYSWVRDWTPVNEPLTTARFSALYGHWYPHRTDERDFWLALLNQIDATRLSMKAIRRVNPEARLVQTEDFGATYGTAPCASQVRFENDRRLMTWDLLCGRVTAGHPLFQRLAWFGLGDRLAVISEDPCPPDVIGMNHYVTSDRFLDHRLDRYPPASHGANAELAYADVEAVRAMSPRLGGWRDHLSRLWDRYGLPLAVTECHLGAESDEQIRWFHQCWRAASDLSAEGASIEAVTTWSLLGAVDWDSLLTRTQGRYEAGAFDVSSGQPVAGDLARWLTGLARREPSDPPAGGGWWSLEERRCFHPEIDDPPDGALAA